MFLFSKPSTSKIKEFLCESGEQPFSYPETGASRLLTNPGNYPINQFRGELGTGSKVYHRAIAALYAWQMYNTGWTEIYPAKLLVKEGEVVVVLARHFGFYSLNPCRIVYTLEENAEETRVCGFAIGTLPDHSEAGEERFTVEWNQTNNIVSYELFAFARAAALLAKFGFPVVRTLQKQFAKDSYQAIFNALVK